MQGRISGELIPPLNQLDSLEDLEFPDGLAERLAEEFPTSDKYELDPDSFKETKEKENRRSGDSLDTLEIMYQHARSFDLLTPEEVVELAQRIERGDLEAKDALVNANLRLLFYFGYWYTGKGMAFIDIIQEGTIALIRAAEKYDFRKGAKFSSYAGVWIRQRIARALPKYTANIKLPEEVYKKHAQAEATRHRMTAELRRLPSIDELAAEMGMTVAELGEIYDAKYGSNTISFDTPVFGGDDYDSEVLLDLLPGDPDTVFDEVESNVSLAMLREALKKLSPDEYAIVRGQFGLKGFAVLTQVESSRRLNIAPKTLRTRQNQVLSKLRECLRELGWMPEFD